MNPPPLPTVFLEVKPLLWFAKIHNWQIMMRSEKSDMVIKRRLLGARLPDKKKMNKIIINIATDTILLTLKSSSTDTRNEALFP